MVVAVLYWLFIEINKNFSSFFRAVSFISTKNEWSFFYKYVWFFSERLFRRVRLWALVERSIHLLACLSCWMKLFEKGCWLLAEDGSCPTLARSSARSTRSARWTRDHANLVMFACFFRKRCWCFEEEKDELKTDRQIDRRGRMAGAAGGQAAAFRRDSDWRSRSPRAVSSNSEQETWWSSWSPALRACACWMKNFRIKREDTFKKIKLF